MATKKKTEGEKKTSAKKTTTGGRKRNNNSSGGDHESKSRAADLRVMIENGTGGIEFPISPDTSGEDDE